MNENLYKNIVSELKAVRVLKGMSQEELAGKSGLHRTYIGSVERGERNITLVSFLKICGALQVNASTIFYNAENKNNDDSHK
ncbi:helix-turn-helix domain-containing protein [Methylomagnum ishizawai]|uniref:helix-turn-helix domain-containing protein n=1 Tax=Methylomagnum ishizawai TaxID=1760988 RepID=UPI001C33C9F0|nr:helix-turn-helix transcriptional regulator [Methylomagnum ishizawai]BBL73709.1 transcriptional regulator [Methylomagnum ishizawai]